MKNIIRLALALAGIVTSVAAHSASYPGAVISYDSGGLPASVASYTNSSVLVAEPARSTPGQWGGPVDPFSPPYLNTQLLSIGTNGSVTVAFDRPVLNNPANSFGVDFILFANSGFMITNGDYTGGGVTDGSLFGINGAVKVAVSQDNVHYYALKPGSTGTGLFPTDGVGDFGVAVDPSIKASDFGGKDLSGIRGLYKGSAGGIGFDIAWAENAQGGNAGLADIRYIRIETTDGHFEIGGLSAVSAPPGYYLSENFTADPTASGWNVAGDSSLFHWNGGALDVAWDSSKSNSFYYHNLPRTVTAKDSFALECDLKLNDIAAGVNPDKTFAFELAIGFINLSAAQSPQFRRGTGSSSPNLVELDYFPDTGFGATISPAIVSGNNKFEASFTYPMELAPDASYRLAMSYAATDRTLRASVTRDGISIGAINDLVLSAGFTDFAVDAVSISSYSDAGAGGSLLAHGTVDNIKVTVSEPAAFIIAGAKVSGLYKVGFQGDSKRSYALERSTNLISWSPVSDWVPGADGEMELSDPAPPVDKAFYRVKER